MTALSQSMKRKLSLLQLADELGNVARACKIMGYHRDTFYEVRRAFQTGGVAALVEQRRGARNPHPNRIAPQIEAKVLDYCLQRPTHGAARVANELRLSGVEVSPSGVRGVWLRHDLETRYKRLMRLERESRDNTTFVLTDDQVRLLERHSPDFRCRHVQSSAPGGLLNQDTLYWGSLKGVGKVYVQVVVDTFCSLAFAKCFSSKMLVTACDLLHARVLPFYDALGVAGERHADWREHDQRHAGFLLHARQPRPAEDALEDDQHTVRLFGFDLLDERADRLLDSLSLNVVQRHALAI